MASQGKIVKARANDMPQFKNAGWRIVEHKAFRRIEPELLAAMTPMPQLQRSDYKQFLRDNEIPYEF